LDSVFDESFVFCVSAIGAVERFDVVGVVVSCVSDFIDGVVVLIFDESEASAPVETSVESPVVVIEI